jgi:dynein light chain Tctex-type 1
MADYEGEQQEDVSINPDKITEEINTLMKQKLLTEKWLPKKVDGWTKDLIESTLKMLSEMKKPFKFVVTCVIMQKTGGGLSGAYCSRWDALRDGAAFVEYDNEHLQCVISLFWVKLD